MTENINRKRQNKAFENNRTVIRIAWYIMVITLFVRQHPSRNLILA